MQIFIPTARKYDYTTARKINEFFASYFVQKYPEKFTIERTVEKRGRKLYFDYLQMWKERPLPWFIPKSKENATVSMPVTWSEVKKVYGLKILL